MARTKYEAGALGAVKGIGEDGGRGKTQHAYKDNDGASRSQQIGKSIGSKSYAFGAVTLSGSRD